MNKDLTTLRQGLIQLGVPFRVQNTPGVKGETGATGATGAAGTNGTNGANGATWYEGSPAPSTLHTDGDFYLRTTNGAVYQQQTGAWVLISNITGPTGSTGATGPTGPVITIPGPYVDDAAAALAGVAIGSPYYQVAGNVQVRLT